VADLAGEVSTKSREVCHTAGDLIPISLDGLMHLIRSSWPTACGAFVVGCLIVWPSPIRAQTFVELAGGWNDIGPAPEYASYSHGFNVRGSIGRQITPRFLLRFDGFTSQFDETITTYVYPPCAQGVVCNAIPYSVVQSQRIAGLAANGLANVDSRGILYVVGGAGLYDTYGGSARWNIGVSAGAGIAVPISGRLHAVVEAKFHDLLGATYGPPWLMPITVGLRY
jgi:hypothetical protein